MNMVVSSAIAGAAIPTADVAQTSPDDAVIAAGQKFEKLLDQYLPAWLKWARLHREAKAETDAKFGTRDYRSPAWSEPSPGKSAAQKCLREAIDRNGTSAASDLNEILTNEMEPLARVIREAEIETLAGLRAKALVAIYDCMPACASHRGEFDMDNEISHYSLFNAAIDVTGLSELFNKFADQLEQDVAEAQAA